LQSSTDNNLQFRGDRTDGKPSEKQTDRSDDNTGKQRRTQHRARHDAESKPRAAATDNEPRQQPDQTERDKPYFRSSFFRQIFQ
jgi:hypothetical protein